MPSVVRIHPPPPKLRGCSSAGRAIAFQAIGREFEPRRPLIKSQYVQAISEKFNFGALSLVAFYM